MVLTRFTALRNVNQGMARIVDPASVSSFGQQPDRMIAITDKWRSQIAAAVGSFVSVLKARLIETEGGIEAQRKRRSNRREARKKRAE